MQEHYMFCNSLKCKKRLKVLLNSIGDTGRATGKNARELKKLEPLLYENWSAWEPCGKSCFTKRTKICRFPALCGNRPVKEDYKACYIEGDACEKKYLESATRLNTTLSVDYEPDHHNPLDYQTCGRTTVPVHLRISGGKPVIKGSWPWQVTCSSLPQ
ncbi:uncharacterized protein TNIN_341731 [Trichonephila inaurata madagascariensis]|uniref:Uncharacterized protein n=1 Tax=Trichonephila inaurata madagascariensis TaxID=2747483 RepID=A0A8X6X9B0_9ARAC|nr:uncharacterized protein TNIN_341731 [Trichonephila inaurata madagascariensis]